MLVQAVQYNLFIWLFFLLGYFFVVAASWSFDYLSQGWIPSLHLLALGSMGVEQGSILQFSESWIPFLNFLLRSDWFSESVESKNVAGILHYAGDVYSRAHTRSQV